MTAHKTTILLASLIAALIGISTIGHAAEKVGQAVKIDITVSGNSGSMRTGDAVHRNERVRANASGLGQFEFEDGAKLVVGPNASVVIDKYVLGEGGKLKKLTLKITKGTFRFISGSDRNSFKAYTIVTPAGTLGVRG
jgi:hypothetical protein